MKIQKSALYQDVLKEFTKSISRFLSILAMIALGSFVFAGLFVTGPTMRNTLLTYVENYQLQDLTISSPLGLDEDDEQILSSMQGITLLDFGYRTDLMVKDADLVVRAESLTQLPGYEMIQGRLPRLKNEIALDNLMQEKGYGIGDSIAFLRVEENDKYVLNNYDYVIVGFINSPEYLMPTQKGTSSVGSGSVNCFGVIIRDNFQLENYSQARMTFRDVQGLDAYSKDYKEKMQAHVDQLEDAFSARPAVRLQQYLVEGNDEISEARDEISDAERQLSDAAVDLEDARKELNDGWTEYQDGKTEFLQEITDAKLEIEDGQKELLEAKIKLDDGYAEYADGEKKLADSKIEFADAEAELTDAAVKLKDGERQLNAAQKKLDNVRNMLFDKSVELNNGYSQLENGLIQTEQALAQLEAGLSTLGSYLEQTNAGLESAESDEARSALEFQKASLLAQQEQALASKAAIEAVQSDLLSKKQQAQDGYVQISMAEDELDEGQKELNEKLAEFNTKKAEYEDGLKKLEDGRIEIADGEADLEKARLELEDGQREYDDGVQELADAMETLETETAKGEKELKDAYQKLLDGEADYREGQEEYLDELPTAKQEIQDGKDDVIKAGEDLARLKVPDYTIKDRYQEIGFFQYIENSESMDLLSLIFPVFFFLIALLVSLTTMTRMVDEQRLLIGTLKALGYSNWDIMKKYLAYGSLASLTGSLVGIVTGQMILMPVVFKAYSSNFLFHEELPEISPVIALAAILISFLCTGFAAFLTTRTSLAEHASELMRPKTPALGNRIFLERLTPIWRRLSFHNKVTARNIFRYKKRMLMTILGVAGCTAMIFMGFGIRDSIGAILEKQYGEIFRFDTIVIFNENAASEDLQNYHNRLLGDARIAASFPARFEQGVVQVPGQLDQTVNIVVPKSEEAFRTVNVLKERGNGQEIPLQEGAVITEKIASLLGIKSGDTLAFQDDDGAVKTIKITGITENYTGHYLYLPQNYYEQIFGKDFVANSDYILLKNHDSENISLFSRNMLEEEAVQNTLNTNVSSDTIKELIKAMNVVVLVILVASSLLAVVVLYNLTNINVSERIRELSTIMVLGFYPGEVTAYVYRETMSLTAIGILVGYQLGLLLHRFIVVALPPPFVLMDPSVQIGTYGLSAVFTLAFSLVVMLIMHQWLKGIDMVEALKAVE